MANAEKQLVKAITPPRASYQCQFETQFAQVYQRNNKAKSKGKDGMKNIRCFPDHGKGGHVEKGFCGSTVKFSIQSKENDPQLKAWAQFELANGSNRTYKVGDVVSLNEIVDNLERTRFSLSKPWYPTIQTRSSPESIRFVVDEDQLLCVDIVQSPDFQVFCSRRRRTPTSPHSNSTAVASPMSSSASSPVTLNAESDCGTPQMSIGEPKLPLAKRSRSCASGWRDAELAAANLLLMVRTRPQQASTVN